MFARVLQTSVWITVLLVLSASSLAHAQGKKVENERWGFRISAPKGFQEVPLKVDEQWLGAKFLSEKEYRYYDKDTGWSWDYRPEAMVVGFLKVKPEEEPAPEGDAPEGDGAKDEVTVDVVAPYADYEDYLDRTYTGGGFYVDSREELEHAGLKVTEIVVKVEKLARTGPKRIVTWVYHTEEVDYAVHVEVLEDTYQKLKKVIRSYHRSFEVTERKGGLTRQRASSWITFRMMDDGTPEERREARMASELQHRQRAVESLPDGWSAEDRKNCFVLTHASKKFTDEVVDHVTGVMAWLDETFPFIGTDQYVRTPIVRICESRDEYASFVRGGDGGWSSGIEIVTFVDREGWGDWQFDSLGTNTLQHWFGERDRELWWAIPQWLRTGLQSFAADMEFRGRKLTVRPDSWESTDLRERVSKGRANSAKDLVLMDSSRFYEDGGWRESNALVRYLLYGKGSKSKRSREVVEQYLLHLQRILRERDAKEAEERAALLAAAEGGEPVELDPYGEKQPETEEEEEAQFKKRRERWKNQEQALLQELFTRTFGHWTRKDWEKFDEDYFEAIG